MAIETPRPTQIGGFVLVVQLGALEVENVNQIKSNTKALSTFR